MFNKKYKLKIEELTKENLSLENKLYYLNQKNLKDRKEDRAIILTLSQENQELKNIKDKLTKEINVLNVKLIDRELLRRKSAAKVGGLTSTITKLKKEKEKIILDYEKKIEQLKSDYLKKSEKEKEVFSDIIEKQNKEINHLKFLVEPPTIEELKAGRRNRIRR